MRFSPGCGCCACTLVEDYFVDNPLGGGWVQESGSWSNFGSDYATINGAGLMHTDFGDSPAHQAEVIYYGENAGQKFRVIADYVDVDNYHCLEVVLSDSVTVDCTGTMQLIRRSGGSETTLSDATFVQNVGGTPFPAKICVRDGVASGTAGFLNTGGTPNYWVQGETTLHEGTYAGMATVTSGDHYFDYFHFQRSSSACPGCPTCSHCTGVMPSRLQVVIPTLTEVIPGACCADIDGTYITETTDDGLGLDAYPCAWFAEVDYGCTDPLIIQVTLKDGVLGVGLATASLGFIHFPTWGVDLGVDKPDCSSWSSLELANAAGGETSCSATAAVYITALA